MDSNSSIGCCWCNFQQFERHIRWCRERRRDLYCIWAFPGRGLCIGRTCCSCFREAHKFHDTFCRSRHSLRRNQHLASESFDITRKLWTMQKSLKKFNKFLKCSLKFLGGWYDAIILTNNCWNLHVVNWLSLCTLIWSLLHPVSQRQLKSLENISYFETRELKLVSRRCVGWTKEKFLLFHENRKIEDSDATSLSNFFNFISESFLGCKRMWTIFCIDLCIDTKCRL